MCHTGWCEGGSYSHPSTLHFTSLHFKHHRSFTHLPPKIAADSVGYVFIASTLPGIAIKLSGPYWFHYFTYNARFLAVSLSFVGSFMLVGLFTGISVGLCFFGIILGAMGSAVGEASFLAFSSFYGSPRTCITLWSSGTGFSGVLGYGWYVIFTMVRQADKNLNFIHIHVNSYIVTIRMYLYHKLFFLIIYRDSSHLLP